MGGISQIKIPKTLGAEGGGYQSAVDVSRRPKDFLYHASYI